MNDARSGRNNSWGEATREVQLATILQQAVPGIMMDLALAGIVFKATNRTIGGQMFVEVYNWQDFPSLTGAQIDMTDFIQTFKHRLLTEVLVDLSFSGQADFAVNMNVDLLGETIIELEWNGGEPHRLCVPSFADALLTPLVTGDIRRPTHIARNFQGVFSGVLGDGHTPDMPEGNGDVFYGGAPQSRYDQGSGGGNPGGQGGSGGGYGLI